MVGWWWWGQSSLFVIAGRTVANLCLRWVRGRPNHREIVPQWPRPARAGVGQSRDIGKPQCAQNVHLGRLIGIYIHVHRNGASNIFHLVYRWSPPVAYNARFINREFTGFRRPPFSTSHFNGTVSKKGPSISRTNIVEQ